jgi:hypothetical protein
MPQSFHGDSGQEKWSLGDFGKAVCRSAPASSMLTSHHNAAMNAVLAALQPKRRCTSFA